MDEAVKQQDGMDIALIKMSADRKLVQFAGAHNPLYRIRAGELEIFDADKAPIGGRRYYEHRFQLNELALEPGDCLYLFSDGFADQFGGDRGKKFTYKRLRELLANQQNTQMPKLRESLLHEHITWRGSHEQIDDILIIGLRV
jgi:serine phosphatase RsbU (regulator of sigma subunit)